MKNYQRILVGVDDPERDGRMLDTVGVICQAESSEEVHVVHVSDRSKPPRKLDGVKLTQQTLLSLAETTLQGHGGEKVIAKMITGAPLVEILRYARDQDIDLIVIGRETFRPNASRDDAVLACRITRQATCSVLVLPQGAVPTARRILVPVRDSECSANAVEAACHIAETTGGSVCCLNVFRIQPGYRYVGTSLKEQTASLRRDAQAECERLLARVESTYDNVTTKCVRDLNGKPVPIILSEIEAQSADLVVIGARGRTGAAGVLLGAVTEQLIRRNPKPMLAVKKKGECLNVLRALLALAK
jgi:nucleotide-binding universal stress UspA family protein